jgi:hypothetical protein
MQAILINQKGMKGRCFRDEGGPSADPMEEPAPPGEVGGKGLRRCGPCSGRKVVPAVKGLLLRQQGKLASNDLEEGTIMVNLLSPSQNKPSTMEEPETTQTVSKLTEAESTIASNKKNFWASNARPLPGLRELLAGPPMTEQERNRQTLTEARVRNAVDLRGFYQSPF